jgi:phosphopantetheine--protein transferase-like protein
MMEQHDLLRQTVATFLGMEPQQIDPALSFTRTRMQGSLARTKLYAALEQRLGVQCQAVFTARTYGELHNAIFGTSIEAAEMAFPRSGHSGAKIPLLSDNPNLASSLTCGIDIEMVDNLPVVPDYWEDPFYTTTFTASEIAYCLLQANPPMHFAARWCAKEALKKCDPTYSQVAMRQLEVALLPTGIPFLQSAAHGTWEPLPVALSLSHTQHMAVAVVVKPPVVSIVGNGAKGQAMAPSPTIPGPSVATLPATSPLQRGSHFLPTLLGVGALAMALWAFARTW